MSDKVEKTKEFLKKKYEESPYFKLHEDAKLYRLEHSYRVANIGKEIARLEGFNEEAFVIGCLLHDVGFCLEYETDEDWKNHGKYSANIARPFLESIGIDKGLIEEICYGIEIQVEDKTDFCGESTPLAISIGDADNIDRFDAYRIYENLKNIHFDEMSLNVKEEKVKSILKKLNKYNTLTFGTDTGTKMWKEKIEFQLQFFNRLKIQIENSINI